MNPKIFVIATGWNCENYVRRCVNSILTQKYEGEFHLVIINDGSTDATEKVCTDFPMDKTTIFHFGENKGAAFRRWEVMNSNTIAPEDVIMLVGLDDELLPGAFEKVGRQYQDGMWMTYGNWKNQRGIVCTVNLDFDDYIHSTRKYRSVQYRSTAPNTFKKKLILKLREEDFMIDGKWVMTCTETNLMYCCLEMCGRNRIGIIREPIYLYNENRWDGSILRFTREFKNQVHQNFINRHSKPLYENF